MALNYYELAPGDSFAYGYHRHERQEELFLVQQGAATFETEAGDVVVEAGEVVRFVPGEFQRGVNEGEERVVAFALGAPRGRGTRRFGASATTVAVGLPTQSNEPTMGPWRAVWTVPASPAGSSSALSVERHEVRAGELLVTAVTEVAAVFQYDGIVVAFGADR